jgi:hypothetical protein
LDTTTKLRPEHYPFWSQGRLNAVMRVDVLARSSKSANQIPPSLDIYDQVNDQPQAAKKDTLAKDVTLGNLLVGKLTNIALPVKPDAELELYFDVKEMSDLWIAVTWSE